MEIKKVKNVIIGYTIMYDIEQIHIITPSRVLYAGNYKEFEKMHYDIDKVLGTLKIQILESNCLNCLVHNFKNLYIFISDIDEERWY